MKRNLALILILTMSVGLKANAQVPGYTGNRYFHIKKEEYGCNSLSSNRSPLEL